MDGPVTRSTSLPRLVAPPAKSAPAKSEKHLFHFDAQTWDMLTKRQAGKKQPKGANVIQHDCRRTALDIDLGGKTLRPISSGGENSKTYTSDLRIDDGIHTAKHPSRKGDSLARDETLNKHRRKKDLREGIASLPDLHSVAGFETLKRSPGNLNGFAKTSPAFNHTWGGPRENSNSHRANGAKKEVQGTRFSQSSGKLGIASRISSMPFDGTDRCATAPASTSQLNSTLDVDELFFRPRSKGGITPARAQRKFQSQEGFDSSRVWSLAHKYRLPLAEVQRIAKAFNAMQRDGFGQLPQEELRKCLCKAFDVPEVDPQVVEDAMLASWEHDMTLDSFVSWYVRNMFNHVAECANAEDKCVASDMLVRSLAKECHTTVCGIDRIKREFDRVDSDGNGTLDQEEFERMLHSLFHAKEGDLSKARLEHFWMQIDLDGSGYIDFEEFCQWHTKYFNSDELSCNLVSSFYESYMPDVQRRKCLEAKTETK